MSRTIIGLSRQGDQVVVSLDRAQIHFVDDTVEVDLSAITGNTVTLIAVGTCTLQASQAGDVTWLAATPVTNSFAITISSGGGESGGSGEVPLPLWSLLLLGAGLFGALSRQRRAGG